MRFAVSTYIYNCQDKTFKNLYFILDKGAAPRNIEIKVFKSFILAVINGFKTLDKEVCDKLYIYRYIFIYISISIYIPISIYLYLSIYLYPSIYLYIDIDIYRYTANCKNYGTKHINI